jgi:hypothetical protein
MQIPPPHHLHRWDNISTAKSPMSKPSLLTSEFNRPFQMHHVWPHFDLLLDRQNRASLDTIRIITSLASHHMLTTLSQNCHTNTTSISPLSLRQHTISSSTSFQNRTRTLSTKSLVILFTPYSPPIHLLLTSSSPPLHVQVISNWPSVHLAFCSHSLGIHRLFTACSPPIRLLFARSQMSM